MAKHFPLDFEIGPHCQLATWISHYKTADVYNANGSIATPATAEPKDLKYLYKTVLYDGGGSGLLVFIENRVVEANKQKNKAGKQLITDSKKTAIVAAITNYKAAYAGLSAEEKALTMEKLLTKHPSELSDTVLTLLSEFKDHSFYFPPNCAPESDLAERRTLLPATGSSPLWEIMMPLKAGDKKLEECTFSDLFSTPLKALYIKSETDFKTFTLAKTSGILRRHIDTSMDGDPTSDAVPRYEMVQSGNRKCCSFGQCIESQYPADYCETDLQGFCNSMSDPCHS